MALTLGTNCGLVTTAPTSDPGASNNTIDGYYNALKITTASNIDKITEVGWYLDSSSSASATTNFEVGLYTDSSGSPNSLAFVSRTNSLTSSDKGTWKKVTVDWDVLPSTTYWLAVQVDAVTNSYLNNYQASGGNGLWDGGSNSTLPDPAGGNLWGADYLLGIYAKYTELSGPANLKSYNTNLKANIKSINTNLIANVKSLNTNT